MHSPPPRLIGTAEDTGNAREFSDLFRGDYLTFHLARARSVVSDMVTHLERDGLLERVPHPTDRRRTLLWLTDEGHAVLRREHDVLDVRRVRPGLGRAAGT